MSKHVLIPCTFFTMLAIAACGGGNDTGNDVSGIDGTGSPLDTRNDIVVIGTIEEFGSIIINGVKYETDNAQFTLDDQPGSQTELFVGQVIELTGRINDDNTTGVAQSVSYNTDIKGPVSAVNQFEAQLSVLGQTINVDESTRFNGINSLAEIEQNQILQISGFFNSSGDLVATHVTSTSTSANAEITGVVDDLDSDTKQFRINDLTISYENISIDETLLQSQEPIEIRGTLAENNLFIASEINSTRLNIDNDEQKIELQGLVSQVISPTEFSINGLNIRASNTTVYVNGDTKDITEDARIEVEGELNTEKELIATRIIIINTGPSIFNGSLEKDETVTYTIEATEADKAIWVNANINTESIQMIVSKDRLQTGPGACVRARISFLYNGFCYLENSGPGTWLITLKGITDGTAEYQISAFLRRAILKDLSTISVNQDIAINTFAGDRRVYTMPAGPQDTVFMLKLEGEATGDYVYIQADEPASQTNYACRFTKRNNNEDICRIKNEGVTNWFIRLDSVVDANYVIKTTHQQPTIIESGTEINSQLSEEQKLFGAIYQIQAQANKVSVAAKIKDIVIAPEEQTFARDLIRLRINPDITNPIQVYWACEGVAASDQDEQCVAENTRATPWYILVTAEVDASYTLSALTQTERPDLIDLNFGDTINVNNQDGGVQALYRLPEGTPGSVVLAELRDASTNYDLFIDNDPEVRSRLNSLSWDCVARSPDISDEHCRKLSPDVAENQYILVSSATAGSYSLIVDEQGITPLSHEQAITGRIDTQDAVSGDLYRIVIPSGFTTISLILDEQTLPVDLSATTSRPPTSYRPRCGISKNREGTQDEQCNKSTREGETWYVLVKGNVGASYQLRAILN